MDGRGDSPGQVIASFSDGLRFVRADFKNRRHRSALVELINGYRSDPMGGSLPPLTPQARKRLIAAMQRHPTVIAVIAESMNRACGIVLAFRNFSTFKARPLLNIHDLYVLPSFRCRGIGRRLLKAICSIARRQGCCRCTLEVRSDNRHAQSLYRSVGFAPCDDPMEFWHRSL